MPTARSSSRTRTIPVRATDKGIAYGRGGGGSGTSGQRSVHTLGEKKDRYGAFDLMNEGNCGEYMAKCGDQGMQFDTTINRWHPCKNKWQYQYFESVFGISLPRRFGMQSVVAESDEVPGAATVRLPVRRRGVPACALMTLIMAQGILVDYLATYPTENDRAEFARLPAAGIRIRLIWARF